MKGPLTGLAAALAVLLAACSEDGGEATPPQDGSTSANTGSTGDATDSTGDVPLPARDVLFSDRLLNIAHAGGKGTRPEHTMLAYETALTDGADVLELDVHATSDGVLIAMHDDTVDRTTDGTGAVSDMTLAKLQSLDAGYTYSPDDGASFPYRGMGLTVPTVEEVFTAFGDVPYVIEIKQGSPSIVEPLLQACRDHGIDDQVVISGFDGTVMEELRMAAPQIPTGFSLPEVIEFMSVTEQTEADYVPPGQFLQVPIDQGAIQVLTPAFVARADRFGLKVHAWTINEVTEMQELIDLGVDGIITDYPARLRDLSESGCYDVGVKRLLLAALVGLNPCAPSPSTGTTPSESTPGATPGSSGAGVLHENQTIEIGGQRRSYHFYEAGGAPSPRPLVLVLHGGSATIDAFIGKPRGAAPMAGVWLSMAEAENLHIAIPQGRTRKGKRHWNDCRSDRNHCGQQDDVDFLVSLVRSLSERYPVDPQRIYVAGESNGGFMALRLAQEQPDVFAAYASVIALMPANNECGTPQHSASIAFVVGTRDAAVRYAGGPSKFRDSGTVLSAQESVEAWLQGGRCSSTPKTEKLPNLDPSDGSTVTLQRHACAKTGDELLLYSVDGGGHVVPSRAEPVSKIWESVVGTQSHDLETVEALWRFFEAHPKHIR